MDKLRRSAVTAFRLNGFSLSGDASNYLVQILGEFSTPLQGVWLDKILDRIQRQTLQTSLISKDLIAQAMKECGRGDEETQDDWLHIILAYDVPKLLYDIDRKKFLPDVISPVIFPAGVAKPQTYRYRYSVLFQRTLHHQLFTPVIPGVDSKEQDKKYSLKTVEFLAGSTAKIGDVIVLGMITELKEGKYYLEDITGFVELDVSETTFQSGFYTENCFVLAQGYYEDSIFHVKGMGPPIAEEASISRSYFGMTNFFGGPPTTNREMLMLTEQKQRGFFFTVISDLHIDNLLTLKKLRVLFEGYKEAPGGMFILMGNFLSEPTGTQRPVALRDAFKNLADLIAEFPNIRENFTFVIVPGPSDAGFVNVLPRPPFVDVITSYFREKVTNFRFATNPCRIKYCTKEIIILREDVMTKMVRNTIYHPPNENYAEVFVKTIIGQAHLCPLPLQTVPIYWNFDHALSLYPLPDLLIIGDKGDPFRIQTMGCHFINPGSFLNTDFCFNTYTPFDNTIDSCRLPTDNAD